MFITAWKFATSLHINAKIFYVIYKFQNWRTKIKLSTTAIPTRTNTHNNRFNYISNLNVTYVKAFSAEHVRHAELLKDCMTACCLENLGKLIYSSSDRVLGKHRKLSQRDPGSAPDDHNTALWPGNVTSIVLLILGDMNNYYTIPPTVQTWHPMIIEIWSPIFTVPVYRRRSNHWEQLLWDVKTGNCILRA